MLWCSRWLLVRLGVTGWLLVGVPACSHEGVDPHVRDGVAGADRVSRVSPESENDDARARELAAAYAQEVATDSDRRLAEQGDADAQALLSVVYYNGRGVTQDYEEAVRWARLAADQGNARGQSMLGAAYYNGHGVAQDLGEAARWTRLAAEQGDVSAQALLGVLYLNGAGVSQDDVSAYTWLTVAALDGGVAGIGRLRDLIANRMTPEQIAQAQSRARDWGK